MRFLWLILIGSCLLSVPLHAQRAGATFLLISPSPQFNGMGGGTGVAVSTEDPYASHYNPANGLRQQAGLSTTVSTVSTAWLPRLTDQLRYDYTVVSGAYRPHTARWTLGASYHYNWFDMGRQRRVNDPALYHSYARVDIGYLQASYQDSLWIVPWRVAVGLGGKFAIQQFAGGDSARSQNLWGDLGLLWTAALPVPIPATAEQLHLTARPTLGVSRLNAGQAIDFAISPAPEPAPRTVRVGGTVQLALQWRGTRDLVRYTHSHAASDVLARSMIPVRYQSGWGDLDLREHLWRNQAGARVMVSAGSDGGSWMRWRGGRDVIRIPVGRSM